MTMMINSDDDNGDDDNGDDDNGDIFFPFCLRLPISVVWKV